VEGDTEVEVEDAALEADEVAEAEREDDAA